MTTDFLSRTRNLFRHGHVYDSRGLVVVLNFYNRRWDCVNVRVLVLEM